MDGRVGYGRTRANGATVSKRIPWSWHGDAEALLPVLTSSGHSVETVLLSRCFDCDLKSWQLFSTLN